MWNQLLIAYYYDYNDSVSSPKICFTLLLSTVPEKSDKKKYIYLNTIPYNFTKDLENPILHSFFEPGSDKILSSKWPLT